MLSAHGCSLETVMGRKFLVGMMLVAILCAVGASGYQFGKHLKERERAAAVQPASDIVGAERVP